MVARNAKRDGRQDSRGLQNAGVELIDEDGDGPGVRLSARGRDLQVIDERPGRTTRVLLIPKRCRAGAYSS
jgi:hypothetical protein